MKLAACQRFDAQKAPHDWAVEPIRNRLWLEYGSSLTESERGDGAFPVFGSNGQVGTHAECLVQGPGILVGRKGSVGEVHFSQSGFWPIDTVYYVRRLADDDWHYLYYLLGFLNLGQLNAATGVPGLTRRDAHFMLGAFPKVSEQRAISTILFATDEAIKLASKELTAARQLKTALMQQLFVGGVPGRHTQTKPAKAQRFEFQVPETWDVSRLKGSLMAVEYGSNAPSNDTKHGLPIVAIPEVIASRFRLGECSYAEVPEKEAKALRLQPDDVLLIRTNGNSEYIGKSTVIGEEAKDNHLLFASYLIRLRTCKEKVLGRYLNYFLASPLGRRQCLAMANTSAGNHNLSSRSIKQFCFPRPLPEEQDEIVELVDSAEDAIEAIQKEIVALNRLKRSLLQHLLNGKVRVRV